MKKENESDETEAERPRLSKRTVTENALKLADADGLDALTIRKLAQHLGVTPMALYWHFRSKEDLLEGVAEQVWGEIDVNVDPDAPWWAQLQGLLESLVAVLRAHSAAAQLLLEHEKRNEAALRATEVTLDVLRRAGFDPQHASAIARSTLWTGITLVMSEPGYHPELPPEEREETQRRSQDRAGHAAREQVPAADRVRGADDQLRRARLPLPVRHRAVHRRRQGRRAAHLRPGQLRPGHLRLGHLWPGYSGYA